MCFNYLPRNVLMWHVRVNVWQMLSWQVKEWIRFLRFVLEFRVSSYPPSKSITHRVNKNGEVGEITQQLRYYSNIFWRKKSEPLFCPLLLVLSYFFISYSWNFVVCNAIHSFIDLWLCCFVPTFLWRMYRPEVFKEKWVLWRIELG